MATDQLARVTRLMRETMPDALLGLYLYGSAVVGGLKPTSDLDMLALAGRPTSAAERRALIEQLLPISGPGDATGRSRSLDLEIVAQGDVRPWRYPPRLDFQFGDWHRPAFATGNLAPWRSPNPDLALVLTMVSQANRPLFGPPPGAVLDPVPWADLRRAMLDSLPDLLADLSGDKRNVVLTLARIWTTLATGVFRPKDEAAEWALPRLPAEHRAVLAYATAHYLSGAPEDWADLLPHVRPFVDHVIGAIHAVA